MAILHAHGEESEDVNLGREKPSQHSYLDVGSWAKCQLFHPPFFPPSFIPPVLFCLSGVRCVSTQEAEVGGLMLSSDTWITK